MKLKSIALLIVLFLVHTASRAQGPVTVYKAQGILSDYDPDANRATIECQAIPGYMNAKTLKLSPRDPADFNKFVLGDILSFELCVSGNSTWIDQATKIGVAPNAYQYLRAPMLREVAEHRQMRNQQQVAPPPRQLAVGDPAPDVALTDQSGHTIHLGDFKGNAVAITFMYTSCPMLTYCPMLSQNFARTQELMARLGAGDKWRLLSISIDPSHDNPARLAAYAGAMHADPAHWTFATGDERKISDFGAVFGLEYQQNGQTISHNLCTVVIDPAGCVYAIHAGNGWTPQQLAGELRSAMHNNPS